MRTIHLALGVLAAACTAAPATATAVVTGQWYAFLFGTAGTSLANGSTATPGINPASIAAPDPNWDFTLASAGTITFVDGFLSGDRFEIFDLGSSIGLTSVPTAGSTCLNDITNCLNDPTISKGTFALAAGAHSISGTILMNAPDTTAGNGYFRIDLASAVPELSTWAMMLLGFGAIGLSLRRRKVAALA